MSTPFGWIRLVPGLASMSLLLACAGTSSRAPAKDRLSYDATRPLITLHGTAADAVNRKQYATDDLDRVLQDLLVADARGKPYPFVLYVHGRGNEPAKSFSNTAFGFVKGFVLQKIERNGVRVLGVNWDSKARDRCERPIDRAQAGGPLFDDIVTRLLAHRRDHPEAWKDRATVLLVHSMGSFVLGQAMQADGAADRVRRLFDVRLITGSDAPALGHASWLPAGEPGKTYVITNPDDATLRKSMKCQKRAGEKVDPRLGMLASADAGERESGVAYVQLEVGRTHRTFTRGGADGNENACNVMLALTTGTVPVLDAAWRVPGGGERWSVPRPGSGGPKPCTNGVDNDDDDGE